MTPQGLARGSALAVLTDRRAGDLLARAVRDAGGRLLTWRPVQVDHRPGRSTTVAYTARVAWADRQQDETLVATTGTGTGTTTGTGTGTGSAVDPAAPELFTLACAGSAVTVWRYPLDPHLPALPTACDPAAVAALLVDLGLLDRPPGAGALTLTGRAYRPGRRAVIEVTTASLRLFLKVTRPERAADLHRRHRLLADAGLPVPPPLGRGDAGLLVLGALPGRRLREALRADGPAACRAEAVLDVLDAMPPELMDLPRRPSWSDGAAHYAAVLAAASPPEADRARRLAAAVQAGLQDSPEPVVPVHGDLYDSHLLVAGGRVTGVLDVDAAGPGHRGDDLGCLLAHAEVLSGVYPGDAERLRSAVSAWLPAFESDPLTDPGSLRLRTAGVLLSLATGPHRVRQPGWQRATSRRLDLVERWLAG